MEKSAEDKSASPTTLVGILFFLNILNWVIILRDFFSSFRRIIHMFIDLIQHAWKILAENKATCPEAPLQKLCSVENLDDKKLQLCANVDDNKLSIGEVKRVMEKLGTFCELDGENCEERLHSHEITRLFEEEPSSEELEEAFDMFDQNNDGFIDAGELRKVLCTLGILEPLEVDCKRMIRIFDDNGDGRIDFKEFVKLLEHSFR